MPELDEAKGRVVATGKIDSGTTLDAILSILIAVLLGLAISFIYGVNWGLKSAVLALLSSVLGYSFGGLIGFLFGFPRYLDAAAITGVDDLKAASGDGGPRGARELRPNLNLERIVDWLMTMIIGATLVNLSEINNMIALLFTDVGKTITGTGDKVVGMLLIVPFAVGGFLHLYMWARRYLIGEWGQSDREALKRQDEALRRNEKALVELKKDVVDVQSSQELVSSTVNDVRGTVFGEEQRKALDLKAKLDSLSVPVNVTSELVRRYSEATKWEDDPFKGLASATSGRFGVRATVTEVMEDRVGDPYKVEVTAEATDHAVVDGDAVFLLHNTYRSACLVKPFGGAESVSASFGAYESFAVGVVIVEKARADGVPVVTLLSIDLAEIPGVPQGFLPHV